MFPCFRNTLFECRWPGWSPTWSTFSQSSSSAQNHPGLRKPDLDLPIHTRHQRLYTDVCVASLTLASRHSFKCFPSAVGRKLDMESKEKNCWLCVCVLRRVRLSATPRTAPARLFCPWQELWSGLPFPSPGNLPHPGIKPASPALAGGFYTTEPLGKPSKEKHKSN